MADRTITLRLTKPHPGQEQVLNEAKRFNVLCCGRRWGKSKWGIRMAADQLLEGQPVGWMSPTYKNLAEHWRQTVAMLRPVTAKANVSEHRLELITGGVLEMWSLESPDTIRGRLYRRVIVDEGAMVRDLLDDWNYIIRSTLIDLEGDAWFLSTPRGVGGFQTMYDWGQDPTMPDWASWRFASDTNPHLPRSELESMRRILPARAYEQEIEARFIDEVSGALWKYAMLDANRVPEAPALARIVVAIDPAVSTNANSDETGIVAAGVTAGAQQHGYVLADRSGIYSPEGWARTAINLYHDLEADHIVAEKNQGGDMVRFTLRTVDPNVPVKLVHASRGKATRAEPVVALDEQGRIHHVGVLRDLETQMTTWSPIDDDDSPDRVDARVWAITDLMLKKQMPKAGSFQG